MKKFTKLLSLLTAAALICSAGALSACGSGDNVVSDEVTAEEWEAAFADENFYNVTINSVGNYASENNSTYYKDNNIQIYFEGNQSGDYDGVYKYGLTSADDTLTGNTYSCLNLKEESQYEYQDNNNPEYNSDTEDTNDSSSYLYYIYDEKGFDSASKTINDGEEGEWSAYSRSYPLYVESFTLYSVDSYLPIVVYAARNYEFEYKDGAYVYNYDNDYRDYLDASFFELTDEEFALFEFEFTGGTTTYSVIIKDGKVYSIQYTSSYSLSYTYGDLSYSYESYSQTSEWIFSDYGTTTVTVPDEVTALFE